ARKARLGLKLTTRSTSAAASPSARQSTFGLADLVEFRYDLAIGDQVLSAAELAELAALKVPLVRVRGQWVELDDRQVKAALKFLERKRSGRMTAGEAILIGVHGAGDDAPLTAVDADGWLGDLLSGQAERRCGAARHPGRAPRAAPRHTESGPPPTPDGIQGELRPYQERGSAWLAFLGDLGLGAVLADDMGLGKTIQLLALVAASARPHGPTLLVCPMSLVGNWQREAPRFTPDLRVHVHHGAERLAGDDLAATLAGADLVITTYGIAT